MRIEALSLEEYYSVGDHTTFCFRLKEQLAPLSSMGNVYPEAFGVYLDSRRRVRINQTLSKVYGDDYAEAFMHLKKDIVALLNAGAKKDYKAIKSSKIYQQFKFKLLSVYYPNYYFPVCTMPAARGYCDVVGITYRASDTMSELNLSLVRWKEQNRPEWTLSKAMSLCDWLWCNN